MAIEVKLSVDKERALNYFDVISPEMEIAIDEVMKTWIEEVKDMALAIRKWEDRSGTLAESHVVVKNGDGGYTLMVNPYLNPLKRVTGDYASFLEYGYTDFSTAQRVEMPWVNLAYEMLQDELDKNVKKTVADVLNIKRKPETITRFGKEFTIYRYPAGTIIGGKKMGGKFAPSLI